MPPKNAVTAEAGLPEEAGSGFFSVATFKGIARMIAIYTAITWITGANSPFRSKTPAVIIPLAESLDPLAPAEATTTVPSNVRAVAVPDVAALAFWSEGSLLDIAVRLSTADDGKIDFKDSTFPSVEWKGLEYGPSGKWHEEWDTQLDLPLSVQHNGSLWIDLFITLAGASPDPTSITYDELNTFRVRKPLTRYMPKVKVRAVKNLLAGTKAEQAEEEAAEDAKAGEEIMPIISYYHPNVTFELIQNSGEVPWSGLPEPLQKWVQLVNGSTSAEGKASYYPITWANDFWLLRDAMNPINETTPHLPLKVTLKPSPFWKFQVLASLDHSFSQQAATTGKPGDLDEVKRTLLETNIWLLLTTGAVSILHMLFEMLAFTSDVSHWRNKKELIGVSVYTILTNCFVQLIVLLYLYDNNENTSWMILGGSAVSLAIEAWKITKAVDISIVPSPTARIGYKLLIQDKHVLSEDELKTQEYDRLAFRWVGYGTAPVLVGYTIYSMVYKEHRGWYSFVITTLTSFVYLFGFVQLVPQLIINWKLKSVAHIPMKTMVYKFLGTIIDDFFSFIVRMPILHRLACFRDDVVFVILLYQMWIYRVDPTRVNEYGQKLSEEQAAKLLAEAEAKAKPKSVKGVDGEDEETKKNK